MEAADYGTREYVYYRILQLTYKVLANSYYGILGEKNSIFYNPFVQNSITLTGQDLITTSIVSLESFLANNFKFRNFDDFVRFVNNILTERTENSILDYLETPKSTEEVSKYFLSKFEVDDFEADDVINLISSLSTEEQNRIYWKNNFREILNEKYFFDEMNEVLKFNYTDKPDPEISERFNSLKKKLLEFCFTDYLFEDRYRRAIKNTRDVICVIDTDSNFINIHHLVEDIKTRHCVDITQSDKKLTIMNVIIDIVTDTLSKTFWQLTTNYGIPENKKSIINMKNEFIYSRLLLTENKKAYAGLIISELGKLIKNKKGEITPTLDIKGLSIKKTNIPKKLRNKFTDILKNDILAPEKIDLRHILKEFDIIENDVETSLKTGSPEYSLPKNLEMIASYKEPSSQEQVRAAIIWNALEPNNQIVPPEKINMLKLTATTPDHPGLLAMKEKYPSQYETIMKVCFNVNNPKPAVDISRFGFSVIALPKSVEKIPEYLRGVIDYDLLVNNNISNGFILLSSLGIYVTDGDYKYKSNLIEL